MKDEYISISEFAKRAGVSHQAIYKRLDKDLQPWLQVADGKKSLNTKALEFFGSEKFATDSTEVATIKMLQKTVELLENELSIKNEQIKSRDSQIEALSERLKESHVLIDQQQKLHAANLIEEKSTAAVEVSPAADIEADPAVPKSGTKKKPWQFWKKA